MAVHRSRIPKRVMEIAVLRGGRGISPGIFSFGSLGRAVGGAMPLRFGREFLSAPLRKRGGLRMTHVYRRGQRQRNRAEHSAILPLRVRIGGLRTRTQHPEMRVLDPLSASPLPILGLPQVRIVVAASAYEFQIFTVGH